MSKITLVFVLRTYIHISRLGRYYDNDLIERYFKWVNFIHVMLYSTYQTIFLLSRNWKLLIFRPRKWDSSFVIEKNLNFKC